jgi:hypothetical protein
MSFVSQFYSVFPICQIIKMFEIINGICGLIRPPSRANLTGTNLQFYIEI